MGGSNPLQQIHPTRRLYWEDDELCEASVTVAAVHQNAIAFDATCFYPGGGGQPCDTGHVQIGGARAAILQVTTDENGVFWHHAEAAESAAPGSPALLQVDAPRRGILARYHTVLHVLNTIALRDYGGWITGVQIGVDHSRIDFKLEGQLSVLRAEFENKVNDVLARDLELKSYFLDEAEFQDRKDLLRTLEARPPVIEGKVRVVEIAGFDAQACGGTHTRRTSGVGTFAVTRTENKGKINKRFYVQLRHELGR